MSYQKHNFEAGAVLFASQLNDMDNQIEFLSNQGSSFSDDFKTALLNCFENVAWINENGQIYYDALYDSLYPDNVWFITNTLTGCVTSNNTTSILKNNSYVATIIATEGYTLDGATVNILMGGNDVTNLYYSSGSINIPNVTGNLVITVTAVSDVVSISAVFTQGSAIIYDTDSLDTLQQYLVVTAIYADSTTTTVSNYTLSGTLEEGISTITVSYGGKTDTFNVTVTHRAIGWYYPFNGSILSSGTEDFGLSGVQEYATGHDGTGLCYYHHVVTEGDSTTDPLGLYALQSTNHPTWSNNDFTLSSWFKSDTNLRGYIFAQSHYVSTASLSWGVTVGNIASGWSVEKTSAYKSYSGLRFGYSSETLYLSITNADGSHGTNFKATPPNSFDSTQWHHYALTRQGAILYVFIDGNIIFTVTLSTTATIYSSSYITIGNWMNSSSTAKTVAPAAYSTYHQDLYINVGNAKWTSAFDPTDIVY